MDAEVLPWTISLPTLVLIAEAVFLLECRQTDRQMRLNAVPLSFSSAVNIKQNAVPYSMHSTTVEKSNDCATFVAHGIHRVFYKMFNI